MKKFTKTATALVLMLAMLFGSAIVSVPMTGMLKAEAASVVERGECGKSGDNLTWILDSDGTLTISGTGAMADWYDEWDEIHSPWTGKNVKKVVIGNGVTTIGKDAFENITSITSVSIGSGVKTIDFCAFYGCEGLTKVTIPSSVRTVGEFAFAYCYKLESVTFNQGVQKIDILAFCEDYSLTTVCFPVSLKRIENDAFTMCYNISKVYYAGTKAQYSEIYIGLQNLDSYLCRSNDPRICGLNSATYYYSCKAPATPKNVKAVVYNYNTIEIYWKPTSNTTGYQIYCAEKKNGPFSYEGAMTPGSVDGCSAGGLVCGKTYYIKIRAYKRVGGRNFYSGFSSVVSVRPIPGKPKLTVSKASSTAAKLTWKKVTGAQGYEIFRSTSKTGTYKKIKTTTALSFKNTGLASGRTYWYKVRAYRKVNGKKVYGYCTLKSVSLK